MGESGWYTQPRRETAAEASKRIAHLAKRLRGFAAELKVSNDGEKTTTAVLVAHFDTIDLLLRELLHVNVPAVGAANAQAPGKLFLHYNCACSTVELASDGRVRALWLNSHTHLLKDGLVSFEKLGQL